MEPYSTTVLWIVIVSFVVAFVLAFGVGANDVANSFGTSVGARVLTLRQACILASIFETSGSILLGYHVSETIRKGIVDVSLFEGHEKELMLGSLAALIGSAIWNLIATALSVPISGTHTVVGATIGYALVARGLDGVVWSQMIGIIISWFVSPLLAGGVSSLMFALLRWYVLRSATPVRNGLLLLPFMFGVTVIINVFSIMYSGSELLRFDKVPLWGTLVASFGAGLLTSLAIQIWLVPYIRRRDEAPAGGVDLSRDSVGSDGGKTNAAFSAELPGGGTDYGATAVSITAGEDAKPVTEATSSSIDTKLESGNAETTVSTENSAATDAAKPVEQPEDASGESLLFAPLQVLAACFASFAHGGNDVSNAVGPLVAVWLIYAEGSASQESESPIFVLAYGGIGITVGLWLLGQRVIRTVGDNLTLLTPATGFTIELGSALTVLIASNIGLPVSTTHCKVGGVVMVGWLRSGIGGVSWKLFGGIAIAWVVTLPVAAGASAAVMALFEAVAV